MEDGTEAIQKPQEIREDLPQRTPVSFPEQPKKKGGGKSAIFVILILILLLGAGAWFIIGRSEEGGVNSSSPTPTRALATPTPAPEQKSINRDEIDIEVLNGTGISGEAAFLQTEIGKLGYEKIKASNATKSDYQDTEVRFAEGVSQDVKDEILAKLKDIYKDVVEKSTTSKSYDIQIIIGYKKGHTSTPTPSPKPTSAATPTPTASGSPTTTTTPTPTSTPTPTQ